MRKIYFFISSLMIFISCDSENVLNELPEQESTKSIVDFKFMIQTNGQLDKVVEIEILELYKKHLQDKGKYHEAENLEETYNWTTGKLNKNAEDYYTENIEKSFNTQKSESDDIGYRAHVEGTGWLNYVTQNSIAGTRDKRKQLEALQFYGMKVYPYYEHTFAQAHVEGTGWLSPVMISDPNRYVGTVGESKRMEAIWINYPGEFITYQVYVDGNWMPWVGNKSIAGTTGESKAIEAFRMRTYE